MNRHESSILRYFDYSHLSTDTLRDISELFYDLAWELESALDDGAEKAVALRKLLEAKDAAVRSALDL